MSQIFKGHVEFYDHLGMQFPTNSHDKQIPS